jgi:hypothetical protein
VASVAEQMDRERLAAKVEWEGGVLATLDYGLRSDDIADPELRQAWADVESAYRAMTPLVQRVTRLLKGGER